MKQLLNENFEFHYGNYTKQDGSTTKVACVVGRNGDSTFDYKETIRNRFGGVWNKKLNAYVWYLGNDEGRIQYIINNNVRPAMEFLTQQENKGNPNRTTDDSYQAFQQDMQGVIRNIEEILQTPVSTETNDIKNKLQTFKEELINVTSSEEFKAKFLPIIKFRAAQGYRFSLMNSILVYLQDPEATLVKAMGVWPSFNRTVLPNAKYIALWVPKGDYRKSKKERDEITKEFLDKCGVKSEDELNAGQKDILRVRLKKVGGKMKFDLVPRFVDVRFTQQMEGKDDVVGNSKVPDDIEWNESGPATELSERLTNAVFNVIADSGVKLEFVDDLGGAAGVSTSGKIKVLKGAPHNMGFVGTCIHEFAHECLHQKYLQKAENNKWSQYFLNQPRVRSIIEQQAELTAWVVLKLFGYNMQTAINYNGIWGLNSENCVDVFDTVAKVADKIYTDMYEEMDKNESGGDTVVTEEDTMGGNNPDMSNAESENASDLVVTGQQIADAVGYGEMYKQGKAAEMRRGMQMESAKKTFFNFIDRMDEAFKH